jgi:acyl dehydratase
MRVFSGIDEFAGAVGEHFGYSEWHTITQDRVQQFADATGDHQWIHLDAERAATGPFGGTIAHGYLTLSLIPMLVAGIYRVDNLTMGINYGLNKVRFPQAVRVGSNVRAGTELLEVTEVAGGKQAIVRCTIEIEGQPKPGCVAETVVRLIA